MGHYIDNQDGITRGVDITLQLHKLGGIMIYTGGHVKSSQRMKDDIIEALLGIMVRY